MKCENCVYYYKSLLFNFELCVRPKVLYSEHVIKMDEQLEECEYFEGVKNDKD